MRWILILLLFICGCGGGGGGDGVALAPAGVPFGTGASGNETPNTTPGPDQGSASSTGDVSFQFVRSQAVAPSQTAFFRFRFFDGGGEEVFSRTEPFAGQIVVENVPVTAIRVEIEALDSGNRFLALLATNFQIVPGGVAEVNLTGVPFTARLSSIEAFLPNSSLEVSDTEKISILAQFSDGEELVISNNQASYTSSNTAVAGVNSDGTVVAIGEGASLITVSVTRSGITRSDTLNVEVAAEQVRPFLDLDIISASGISVPGVTLSPEARFLQVSVVRPNGSTQLLSFTDPNVTPDSQSNVTFVQESGGGLLVFNSGVFFEPPDEGSFFVGVRYDDPVSGEDLGTFALVTR